MFWESNQEPGNTGFMIYWAVGQIDRKCGKMRIGLLFILEKQLRIRKRSPYDLLGWMENRSQSKGMCAQDCPKLGRSNHNYHCHGFVIYLAGAGVDHKGGNPEHRIADSQGE